jgi:hypothetical protein
MNRRSFKPFQSELRFTIESWRENSFSGNDIQPVSTQLQKMAIRRRSLLIMFYFKEAACFVRPVSLFFSA